MSQKAIDTAITIVEKLAGSKKVQKFLCGSYSDGSPRSLPDALNDELLSPSEKRRKKAMKKRKKKKKKNKNKKKKQQNLFTI